MDTPAPVTPGTRIKAAQFNALVAAIRWLMGRVRPLRVGPGLVMDNSGVLRLGGTDRSTFPCFLPAGAIPARVGSTPGSGTVTLAVWNGTALTAGSTTITALNKWKTATPADNTKMCDVYSWDGAYWIASFDC